MPRNPLPATILLLLLFASVPAAQIPVSDASARIREALPADVADRVLSLIADATAQGLPAQPLENRALKFAARGIPPLDIERAIALQAERMAVARELLENARGVPPAGDEIEAAGEALRLGVSGSAVSQLARSAPSGRSLAVPLFVIGGLVDRGLPSDEALLRVLERVRARATDAELERLPQQSGGQNEQVGKGQSGLDNAASKRPEGAGPPGSPGAGASRPRNVPPAKGRPEGKGKGSGKP